MKVGVPKETASGERRVALVPDSTKRLAEAGVEVLVESGAGADAGFLDKAYEETGAQLVGDAFSGVDAVAKVQQPSDGEVGKLGDGQILIAFLQPLVNGDLVRGARRAARDGLLDGLDSAHHPRAADGRALIPEHGRGLQGHADRR